MAFGYAKFENGITPRISYLPGKEDETYTVGEMLVQDGAEVTKCPATSKPDFLCVGPKKTSGEVPVTRVTPNVQYMANLSESGDDLSVGDKVTISADGMDVTATTEDGVAEIVALPGTDEGDEIVVRFASIPATAPAAADQNKNQG